MNIYKDLLYTDKDFTICMRPINKKIKNIEFHPNTRYINSHAFFNIATASFVTFPEKLELIGKDAFAKTAIEEILLLNPTRIESAAFRDLSLRNVIINTKSIPEKCFDKCIINNLKLTNTEVINSFAFASAKISNFTFPDTLTDIKERAFVNATFKNNVLEIPKSVKVIESQAFYLAKNLYRIILPSSLEYLDPEFADREIKIITDKKTVELFPFLKNRNTDIISLDYMLDNKKSFKEINAKFKEFEK